MLAKLHRATKPRRRHTKKPALLKLLPRGGRAQIIENKYGLVVRRRPGHLYFVDAKGIVHEAPLKKGGQKGHVSCYRKGHKVSCKQRRR